MSGNGGARIFGLGPRGARWALGLSLAVNFLILGLVGGVALKIRDGLHFGFTDRVIEAAGPDRRDEVRALIERPKGARPDWRVELRKRWERIAEIIAATPFDPVALDAAFAESDARRAASRAERNAAFAAALALLTDEERAKLAVEIREDLSRHDRD